MTIRQSVCTSFKKEILEGLHNFAAAGGDTFKIALYTSSADLDDETTAYTSSNEVSASGYTAGGNTLTVVDPAQSATVGFVDFADTSWSAAITARGALIYNDTESGKPAVLVLDFGRDVTSTATFTIKFPSPSAENAILRIQ
jgi:hypothetical protein